jgi:hypothetical protein
VVDAPGDADDCELGEGFSQCRKGAQRDSYLGEVAGRGELADALVVVAKASGGEGFLQVQKGSTKRQVLRWAAAGKRGSRGSGGLRYLGGVEGYSCIWQ